MKNDNLKEFCKRVKRGFGTISDRSVKFEYERAFESIEAEDLGKLLAMLEKNELLDKSHSVNVSENFYQKMYTEMNETKKHKIQAESTWRTHLAHDPFALRVLDTVMKKQGGMATDRQWIVLDRARRGDTSRYSTKN